MPNLMYLKPLNAHKFLIAEKLTKGDYGMKSKTGDRLSYIKSVGDELMMNTPHVTVSGNKEVYIENHKGIEVYNGSLVRVETASGSIAVEGESLNIDSVRESDIFISGIIEKIEFNF